MAEKYGVVPPKFSKEWWSYFWMYYKWHTLASLFVILCVAVTIQQCVTAPKYDLTVTYTGSSGYTDEIQERIMEIIRQYTDDVDGNGEQSVFFQQLIISDNQSDAQYNYAMQTKLTLEFQNDCSFVFLMDSDMVNQLIGSQSLEGAFIPVNEWAQGEVDADLLYPSEGEAYAVNLKNSKLLNEASVPCENIYAAICFNNKTDEKNAAAFESSKHIINALIQQ